MLMMRLVCDGEVLYLFANKLESSCIFLVCSRLNAMNTQALTSFKELLEKINEMHVSLVHASVKLKSSCISYSNSLDSNFLFLTKMIF